MTKRSITYMLLFLYLILPISLSIDYICKPCAVPSSTQVIWLEPSKPLCFHPGQPVLELEPANCPSISRISSNLLESIDDGIVLAKERMCFFDGPIEIKYEYYCGVNKYGTSMRIGHPKLGTPNRRKKRWARRRNPDSKIVVFQQQKYLLEVSEDTPVNSLIVNVQAIHAGNQSLYYSMIAPQDSRSQNLFTLDSMSGEIRLAKSLDRETLDKHILKVAAYERLDPTITASTTIVIQVLDVQDNSPVFEKDSYFGEIREDAPIGTTVLSVFARDLDDGENGEVEYSIGNGDGAELLMINSKSGVIQTSAPLDRETLSLIRLDVVASDKGTPKRDSKAMVEITVIDVNDNAPVFEEDSYNVTILENIAVPAVIATVKAFDKDHGLNGKVHYSMAIPSTNGITIDYSTGEVTLREKIDSKSSPITCVIRAKDGAQPALSTTVTLTINIVDVNDHTPTLIAAPKLITIEESVAIGEEIGRIYAIDEDAGPNGIVRYSLKGAEEFAIDSESGIIRTAMLLDREEKERFSITIIAADMGDPSLNTTTTIGIVLKDVNDNAPTFEQEEYNLTISENLPRGSQIIELKAIDKDQDQKITYRIESVDKDVFSILELGEQGAILSLSGNLGEDDDFITIEVSATDQGGLQGRCRVNLIIDDINSAPFFMDHPFSVKIPEHSPIGYPILTMKAEDHDRGDNARITYSIDSTNYFEIDDKTGELRVASDLDREEKASYNVIVTASDHAEPPLSTNTQIEVILDDINDNPPEFTSSSYAATISEDIPVGTSFMQVSAIDADIGNNGIVDYFLNDSISSDIVQLFRLDRTSGTLRVNSKLDREQHEIIELPIIAKDRGTIPLTASSNIILTLADVNDNAPTFELPSYDLYISENSPVGTLVGSIVATDPDEGPNADISFRIFGGNDAKLFDIEEDEKQNGVVHLKSRAEFDFEAKTNKFFIELQASSGQLSSTVPIRVHISDINDNKPILKDFVILINRFENDKALKNIGIIPAFDPDQNATLEFFLEENELIEADKYTGRLVLKQNWNRNIDVTYKACVSDGANIECSKCRFLHTIVEPEWLTESLTLSIGKMSIDGFWDPLVFQRFRDALSTLKSWKFSDIHVISVKSASDDHIHVTIAITENGRLVRGYQAIEIIKESLKSLEQLTLFDIQVIREEACLNEPCSHMSKCRQSQKFVGEMDTHETDNFIARTLSTVNTFICECPTGFTSSKLNGPCDTRINECYNAFCANNGTCEAFESKYRCKCPEGFIGKHCEISVNSLTCVPDYCQSDSVCEHDGLRMHCRHCKYSPADSDERCRLRSVSFDGSGLLNMNVMIPRTQWTIKFRMATIAQNGVVLFAGNKQNDFVEVSIVDKILRVQFSLGGEKAEAKMDPDAENRVNDGRWHWVTLELSNRELTISLNGCDTRGSLEINSPCAARAKIELDSKCNDPHVPCHRFLDISNGLFIGGRAGNLKQIEQPFDGCISDIYLDEDLLDFSNIRQMHKIGTVYEGCRQLRDHCDNKNSCPPMTKCTNRWGGKVCSCPNSVHSTTKCTSIIDSPETRGSSLFEEESFIIFQPGEIHPPFEISFEFRTSRSDMQVGVVEFTPRHSLYKLELEDGTLRFLVENDVVMINAPEISAKHWIHVRIVFNPQNVVTVIDGTYSATSNKGISESSSFEQLYFGIAPGTGHPARFEGCVRNVMINSKLIAVTKKGKTRTGCITPNRCDMDSICPQESTCHREWNKHKCHCHKGFLGDTCRPACSMLHICGSGGTCVPSNSSTGYDCLCPSGKTGSNCQFEEPLKICPKGWWGTFPHCKKCACATNRGYETECHRSTGACLCRKSHFSTINGCVKCECGVGAESNECDVEGYCKCRGDAVGRRCDRCSRFDHLLDPKTLKCNPVPGKCPSNIENSIQWPTTVKGATVRQSCKNGEMGLATRNCLENGRWSEVNSWNCTRAEYSIMVNKFDILEPMKLLTMVTNATQNEATIRGRNQQIAAEAIAKLIDTESSTEIKSRSHVRDMSFTRMLMESMGKVMSEHPARDYIWLVEKVWLYAKSIDQIHESLPFLPPFFISSDHLSFAYDKLDFGNFLPKFNNFIDTRVLGFPNVRMLVTGTTRVVYSILAYPRCYRCENPIVVIVANTSDPLIIEFEIYEKDGWKYPECVKFDQKAGVWHSRGTTLVGLNLTHSACEFYGSGIYTMFVNGDNETIVRVSNIDGYVSPAITACALLMCLLSIIITIIRKRSRNNSIRAGFILFYGINLLNLFFVHKMAINQLFCPARNAILSFTTCAPFAWLFLYGINIYRKLAASNTTTSFTTNLLIGLVMPLLISFTTFLFTSSCSLSIDQWLFWFLLIPIAMFILLSFYAVATTVLVAINKKYDVFMEKYHVKHAIYQHILLTIFTLFTTLVGLFINSLPFDIYILDVSQATIFLIGALVVFIWAVAKDCQHRKKKNENLWLDDHKPNIDEPGQHSSCASPLLERKDEEHWIEPNIIVNERAFTTTTPDTINHILSPADKILNDGIGHIYGNNLNTLPRLHSAQDEADDAYYTYTASRSYKKTKTFN